MLHGPKSDGISRKAVQYHLIHFSAYVRTTALSSLCFVLKCNLNTVLFYNLCTNYSVIYF